MNNTVRSLRIQRRLTQDELAEILGIARPTLSNIERGVHNPGGKLLFKIAGYFGKPAEQIFFESPVLQEDQK
jgi:putative transcriptional regulator